MGETRCGGCRVVAKGASTGWRCTENKWTTTADTASTADLLKLPINYYHPTTITTTITMITTDTDTTAITTTATTATIRRTTTGKRLPVYL